MVSFIFVVGGGVAVTGVAVGTGTMLCVIPRTFQVRLNSLGHMIVYVLFSAYTGSPKPERFTI